MEDMRLTGSLQVYNFILDDLRRFWESFAALGGRNCEPILVEEFVQDLRIKVASRRTRKAREEGVDNPGKSKKAPSTLFRGSAHPSWPLSKWDGSDAFQTFGGWEVVKDHFKNKDNYSPMVIDDKQLNTFWWGEKVLPTPTLLFEHLASKTVKKVENVLVLVSEYRRNSSVRRR